MSFYLLTINYNLSWLWRDTRSWAKTQNLRITSTTRENGSMRGKVESKYRQLYIFLNAAKIGESNGIFSNIWKNIFREMPNFLLRFFHFSFPFSSTKLGWNLSSLSQLSNDTKIISIEQRLLELLCDFTKCAKLKKTDFNTYVS